jgi:hypothetical protein
MSASVPTTPYQTAEDVPLKKVRAHNRARSVSVLLPRQL